MWPVGAGELCPVLCPGDHRLPPFETRNAAARFSVFTIHALRLAHFPVAAARSHAARSASVTRIVTGRPAVPARGARLTVVLR